MEKRKETCLEKYGVEHCLQSKSVIEKYDNLELNFPNIHQRIPQYLIASYLGITAVHLCNLKKCRKTYKIAV
jgi:hypothetical protein